jgi:hypothetical protein
VRRRKEPTFTAKDVCQALNVPHGTLNSWAFHGWFVGLDAEKTTPGKARRFSLRDLFQLAIMKQLVDIGLLAEKARNWADICVRHMDQWYFTEFHALRYPDDDEWVIHLDDFREPPRSGASVRLTVYPVEIVNAVKQRLGMGATAVDLERKGAQ